MPNVNVNCRFFRGRLASINGISTLNVGRTDLIRSAITVGALGFGDLVRHGLRSFGWHMVNSISLLIFTDNRSGNLSVSDFFSNMDSSEMGDASYKLGMTLTKIIAEKKLDIPWLAHVELMMKLGVIKLTQGSHERGDLVGRDRSKDWHVLEAKGRSSPPSTGLFTKAKRQAARITGINGIRPLSNSACIVKLYQNPIAIDLWDPEGNNKNITTFEMDESEFINGYYRIVKSVVSSKNMESVRLDDLEFKVSYFHTNDSLIGLGLESRIFENSHNAYSVAKNLIKFKDVSADLNEPSIGADGIYLKIMK